MATLDDPLNQKVNFALYTSGPDMFGRDGYLGIKVEIPGQTAWGRDQYGIVISQATLREMGLVLDLMPGEKKKITQGDLDRLAEGQPPRSL